MDSQDIPLLSLISALSMPELGVRKQDIHAMTLAKLDEYILVLTDEAKRAAALEMRIALQAWSSSEPTEEIAEAAQAMLVAEGHGEQRINVRQGRAWFEVMPWINAFAHPESHTSWLARAAVAIPKLDAYLDVLTDENRRAAAIAMRTALIAWTSSDLPEAVKHAAQAMLVVEDYASFRSDLRKVCGTAGGNGDNGN